MIDIRSNRKARKYRLQELVARVLWAVASPLFRYSPRVCFGWRCFLLRLFRARVGHNVHIYNSAVIYMPWNFEIGNWSCIGEEVLIYNLGRVSIGNRATVSHRAHLCAGTHDYSDVNLPLLKLPIRIDDQVWICADSFVGPGTHVGEGAILGARAVVMRDVEPWDIVAGNPARVVKKRVLQRGDSCE